MKRTLLAALAASTLAAPALAQDNPWAGFKGKLKEGNWEYKMQMEGVPGMPAGMGAMTFNRCLTAKDVDQGGFAQRDNKMPDGCTVKDMKVAGNGATWKMVCVKDPRMVVDSTMTFGGDSFTMKQNMQMNQGGQVMNMTQNMTGRLVGPCAK